MTTIERFRATNFRLPTPQEFSGAFHQGRYQVVLEYPPYSEEVLRRFGPPTGDAYLLTVWRGEWTEYYASWRKLSSITQNRADYYILGSPWAERTLFGLGAVLFLVAARGAWPARSPRVRPN